MLDSMRKGSKNILVKATLLLLAVSFVVWGVGDVLRGTSATDVADIEGQQISANEFARELEVEKARYKQIFGQLSEEQIAQMGLKQRVLSRLVQRHALAKRMNEIGLTVGAETAKDLLLNTGMFTDESGDFSKESFEIFLKNNRLQKDEYINSIKRETATSLLMSALEFPANNIDSIANFLNDYRNETRKADIMTVPATFIKSVREPSETDLVQYYQENTNQFAVPQLRKATYIIFSQSDIARGVEVSEEDLRHEYEISKDSYVKPSTRVVEQYVFSDEAKAKLALNALNNGKVGQYSKEKTSLGEVSEDGLPEDIASIVFALEEKTYSQPFESALGWHVFYVSQISASRTLSFNEVKEEIESYIKEQRVAQKFEDFSYQVEDAFASGLNVEQVAEKFDVAFHNLPAVDSRGFGSGNKKVKNIENEEEILELIFQTEQGEISSMTLLQDNQTYAVVKVSEIFEPRTKALDEVKGMAREFWKEQQKKIELAKKANEFAQQINEGKSISSIAKSNNFDLKKNESVERNVSDASANDFPDVLRNELFIIKQGKATSAYANKNGDYVIAKLNEVEKAEKSDEVFEDLKSDLQNQISYDLINQYISHLSNKYDVTQNQALINSIN